MLQNHCKQRKTQLNGTIRLTFGNRKKRKKLEKKYLSVSLLKILNTETVVQARRKHSPFDFIDMSIKKEWQKRCKTKIKRCDGVISLLSKNTHRARWEMKCAKEEKINIIGIHIKK